MLYQLGDRTRSNRTYQSSPLGRAYGQAAAEAILEEGVRAAGLSAEDLLKLKGSDERKIRIARAIHTKTSMPQKWTAAKSGMKSAANVSQLRLKEQKPPDEELNLSRFVD